MLNEKDQAVFDEYVKEQPTKYTVPEPPRDGVIRIYDKTHRTRFTLLNAPEGYEWRSVAKIIDTKKNYWEKTPLSTERLWTIGLWHYLVPEEDSKFFEGSKYTDCGIVLFTEDAHNQAKLFEARERYMDVLDEQMQLYEVKLIEDLAGLNTTEVKVVKTPTPRNGPEAPIKKAPKKRGRPRKAKLIETVDVITEEPLEVEECK